MQLIKCGKGIFGFYMWMQETKYVLVFSDLINVENKSACKSVGNVFLMIKIGPGFMGLLVYSLIKLGGIKHKIDDRTLT
jgi:hypothetical protein